MWHQIFISVGILMNRNDHLLDVWEIVTLAQETTILCIKTNLRKMFDFNIFIK